MRVSIPVLMVLVTPAFAGAQQGSASVAASTSAATPVATAEATGNAAADARIERAVAAVEAEGMSSVSLAERVQLGRARGVDATRIATAVESRADALIDARDALRASGEASIASSVELAADAIEGGARASHVTSIAAEFGDADRPRALAALGTLATEGRIGADVIASVRGALDAGSGTAASSANAGAAVSATTSATAGVAGAATSVGASAASTVTGALPR